MAFKINTVEFGTQRADQFQANPLNPRVHPQHQRDVINASLKRFGFISPVIVSKRSGYLIDGHERVWQALAEGDDTPVPYVIADVEEDHEAELILTYDKSTMLAEYDPVNLQALMEQVNTDDEVLAKLFADMKEEYIPLSDEPLPDNPPSMDKAEELKQKWKTERGQLWIIPTKHGEHRLLCGDSTLKADVDRVMGGDKAELLVTDPPYNVGIEYGHNVDDVKHAEEYEAFSRAWFEVWRSVSKFQIVTPGYNNLYVWCRLFEKPYHVAPWTKTNSMTRGHVSRFACFEPVMFYGKGWKRVRANDVFDFPISAQTTVTGESLTKQHPCPKPLSMWIDIIENYTDELEIVVDAFGGSGTTMVACEQLGRLCRMIEIEPKYVAVILERMATLGLEPRLA